MAVIDNIKQSRFPEAWGELSTAGVYAPYSLADSVRFAALLAELQGQRVRLEQIKNFLMQCPAECHVHAAVIIEAVLASGEALVEELFLALIGSYPKTEYQSLSFAYLEQMLTKASRASSSEDSPVVWDEKLLSALKLSVFTSASCETLRRFILALRNDNYAAYDDLPNYLKNYFTWLFCNAPQSIIEVLCAQYPGMPGIAALLKNKKQLDDSLASLTVSSFAGLLLLVEREDDHNLKSYVVNKLSMIEDVARLAEVIGVLSKIEPFKDLVKSLCIKTALKLLQTPSVGDGVAQAEKAQQFLAAIASAIQDSQLTTGILVAAQVSGAELEAIKKCAASQYSNSPLFQHCLAYESTLTAASAALPPGESNDSFEWEKNLLSDPAAHLAQLSHTVTNNPEKAKIVASLLSTLPEFKTLIDKCLRPIAQLFLAFPKEGHEQQRKAFLTSDVQLFLAVYEAEVRRVFGLGAEPDGVNLLMQQLLQVFVQQYAVEFALPIDKDGSESLTFAELKFIDAAQACQVPLTEKLSPVMTSTPQRLSPASVPAPQKAETLHVYVDGVEGALAVLAQRAICYLALCADSNLVPNKKYEPQQDAFQALGGDAYSILNKLVKDRLPEFATFMYQRLQLQVFFLYSGKMLDLARLLENGPFDGKDNCWPVTSLDQVWSSKNPRGLRSQLLDCFSAMPEEWMQELAPLVVVDQGCSKLKDPKADKALKHWFANKVLLMELSRCDQWPKFDQAKLRFIKPYITLLEETPLNEQNWQRLKSEATSLQPSVELLPSGTLAKLLAMFSAPRLAKDIRELTDDFYSLYQRLPATKRQKFFPKLPMVQHPKQRQAYLLQQLFLYELGRPSQRLLHDFNRLEKLVVLIKDLREFNDVATVQITVCLCVFDNVNLSASDGGFRRAVLQAQSLLTERCQLPQMVTVITEVFQKGQPSAAKVFAASGDKRATAIAKALKAHSVGPVQCFSGVFAQIEKLQLDISRKAEKRIAAAKIVADEAKADEAKVVRENQARQARVDRDIAALKARRFPVLGPKYFGIDALKLNTLDPTVGDCLQKALTTDSVNARVIDCLKNIKSIGVASPSARFRTLIAFFVLLDDVSKMSPQPSLETFTVLKYVLWAFWKNAPESMLVFDKATMLGRIIFTDNGMLKIDCDLLWKVAYKHFGPRVELYRGLSQRFPEILALGAANVKTETASDAKSQALEICAETATSEPYPGRKSADLAVVSFQSLSDVGGGEDGHYVCDFHLGSLPELVLLKTEVYRSKFYQAQLTEKSPETSWTAEDVRPWCDILQAVIDLKEQFSSADISLEIERIEQPPTAEVMLQQLLKLQATLPSSDDPRKFIKFDRLLELPVDDMKFLVARAKNCIALYGLATANIKRLGASDRKQTKQALLNLFDDCDLDNSPKRSMFLLVMSLVSVYHQLEKDKADKLLIRILEALQHLLGQWLNPDGKKRCFLDPVLFKQFGRAAELYLILLAQRACVVNGRTKTVNFLKITDDGKSFVHLSDVVVDGEIECRHVNGDSLRGWQVLLPDDGEADRLRSMLNVFMNSCVTAVEKGGDIRPVLQTCRERWEQYFPHFEVIRAFQTAESAYAAPSTTMLPDGLFEHINQLGEMRVKILSDLPPVAGFYGQFAALYNKVFKDPESMPANLVDHIREQENSLSGALQQRCDEFESRIQLEAEKSELHRNQNLRELMAEYCKKYVTAVDTLFSALQGPSYLQICFELWLRCKPIGSSTAQDVLPRKLLAWYLGLQPIRGGAQKTDEMLMSKLEERFSIRAKFATDIVNSMKGIRDDAQRDLLLPLLRNVGSQADSVDEEQLKTGLIEKVKALIEANPGVQACNVARQGVEGLNVAVDQISTFDKLKQQQCQLSEYERHPLSARGGYTPEQENALFALLHHWGVALTEQPQRLAARIASVHEVIKAKKQDLFAILKRLLPEQLTLQVGDELKTLADFLQECGTYGREMPTSTAETVDQMQHDAQKISEALTWLETVAAATLIDLDESSEISQVYTALRDQADPAAVNDFCRSKFCNSGGGIPVVETLRGEYDGRRSLLIKAVTAKIPAAVKQVSLSVTLPGAAAKEMTLQQIDEALTELCQRITVLPERSLPRITEPFDAILDAYSNAFHNFQHSMVVGSDSGLQNLLGVFVFLNQPVPTSLSDECQRLRARTSAELRLLLASKKQPAVADASFVDENLAQNYNSPAAAAAAAAAQPVKTKLESGFSRQLSPDDDLAKCISEPVEGLNITGAFFVTCANLINLYHHTQDLGQKDTIVDACCVLLDLGPEDCFEKLETTANGVSSFFGGDAQKAAAAAPPRLVLKQDAIEKLKGKMLELENFEACATALDPLYQALLQPDFMDIMRSFKQVMVMEARSENSPGEVLANVLVRVIEANPAYQDLRLYESTVASRAGKVANYDGSGDSKKWKLLPYSRQAGKNWYPEAKEAALRQALVQVVGSLSVRSTEEVLNNINSRVEALNQRVEDKVGAASGSRQEEKGQGDNTGLILTK